MSNYAKAKLVAVVQVPFAVPGLLAVNTMALLILGQHGGLPIWLKSAAALFLAF